MKRFGKALIVAGSLVVSGILIGCVGNVILYSTRENRQENPVYEEKYYSIAASEIDQINLDLFSEDIKIKPGDKNEIEIAYWDEIEEPKYQISERNGTLLIDKREMGTFHLFYIPTFQELFGEMEEEEDHEMIITVPQDYVGGYDLDISSGSIEIADLTVEEELELYATSGSIDVENVVCNQDIRADMTSGYLKLQNLDIKGDCRTNLTSGNIQIDDVTVAGNFEVNFTSGSASCDVLSANELYLNATSGEYDFTQITVKEGIYVDATSGDFTIGLTDKMENYSIDTDLTSGSCNLPESYADGEKRIWVSLTSGSANFSFEGDTDRK